MTNADNLIFNSNNQHYYQVTDTNYQSWADAVNNASELGGYLVSIDDETESDLLQQRLNSADEYWIGSDEGNVFGAALGESFIASPSDNLFLPGIIEYDSAFDYYTGAGYLDNVVSTLLPDSLSYLWDTVSIQQPIDNQYELSWQDEINLTELFNVDDFLPDVSIDNPIFTITDEESGNSYGFAGNISVGGQDFAIDASFTLEDINGVSNFSWDNIAIPDVSLSNLTSLLGDAVSGLDSFFGNNTNIDVNISEDGAELAWDNDINLTSLFGLGSSFPDLTVDTPTFAIATDNNTTTYEFAGDIKLASGDVGFSSSFVQEEVNGSSEFSWSEIEISQFDLDNITDLLGNSFAGVDNFFNNNLPNLPAVTVGITEDEVELTLAEDIDVSSLLKLNSFLPGLNLSIANPSFAIATENNTNTYELAGDFSVLGETFNLSTSFTQESAGGALKWQDISLPNFSIGTLTGLMGGAFTQVDWAGCY